MAIQIETDKVISAANVIKSRNEGIQGCFPDMEKSVNNLSNCWQGAAASAAIGKFSEIKNHFYEARYNVIDNFVLLLNLQVGENYEKTESNLQNLAAQFK